MKKERAVKKKAKQQAHVFYRMKQPPVLHRQMTHSIYTLPEIKALCAEGWHVTSCQLERIVEVDAIEVTLTGEDAEAALVLDAAQAPLQEHQDL